MKAFDFELTSNSVIDFPEPYKSGWLKLYTEQIQVKNDPEFKSFGIIKFIDNSHVPVSFKFQKN